MTAAPNVAVVAVVSCVCCSIDSPGQACIYCKPSAAASVLGRRRQGPPQRGVLAILRAPARVLVDAWRRMNRAAWLGLVSVALFDRRGARAAPRIPGPP